MCATLFAVSFSLNIIVRCFGSLNGFLIFCNKKLMSACLWQSQIYSYFSPPIFLGGEKAYSGCSRFFASLTFFVFMGNRLFWTFAFPPCKSFVPSFLDFPQFPFLIPYLSVKNYRIYLLYVYHLLQRQDTYPHSQNATLLPPPCTQIFQGRVVCVLP